MFLRVNTVILFLVIAAKSLNGHDIIDTLSFVYGCPTMSGRCSCDISFESGDYFVKVECNGINGDPNDFKNDLKVLRGYAIDLLVISNTYINHLPDSPFVETDGRTPITAISEVMIVNSILSGFGSPDSLSNSFFDGLGYSMVTFTVDNCPYMRTPWQWQRFANSLMATTEPIDQPIKSSPLLPDIETTMDATSDEIQTEATYVSLPNIETTIDVTNTNIQTEATYESSSDFTEIFTDVTKLNDSSTRKLLIENWPTKTTPKPIPPIMEPNKIL